MGVSLGEPTFEVSRRHRLGREELTAAVSVCAPLDLVAGSERISKGVNFLYADMFLGTLKEKLREKAKMFLGEFDAKRIEACNTMFDFDELYTSRIHGFRNAMDYWQNARRSRAPRRARAAASSQRQNDLFLPAWILPSAPK